MFNSGHASLLTNLEIQVPLDTEVTLKYLHVSCKHVKLEIEESRTPEPDFFRKPSHHM